MTIEQVQLLLKFISSATGNASYDPGEIDGEFGNITRGAVKCFQRDYGLTDDGIPGDATCKALKHATCYGMPESTSSSDQDDTAESATQSAEPVVTDGPFAGIKHFSESEFMCKCNGLCDKKTATMDHSLLVIDDKIREHFNRPVIITSGIRCQQHNANVGGVATSRHMYGKANDIVVSGFSASSVLAYVQSLSGVHYCYAIDSSAVHIDV